LVLRLRSDPVALYRTDLPPAGDVLVELARESDVPLHRQIEASLRDAIRSGGLRRGTPLPATRRLAAELGVSRGVVIEAYQQLGAEGYLTSRSGAYTRVAIGPAAAAEPTLATAAPAAAIDFSPCRGDGSMFPRAAWLRSTKRVLADADFGYVSGRGVPALHAALAEYLNRVRGTSARPSDVVICNGYAQGIALVLGVLAAAGARRIAVEDPSADDDAVPAARAAGLEVVGVPVGRDGVEIEALDGLDADALVLTPSHQWPTGAVLSAAGRAAAVRWARERDALIVEDDYDAEYRYDRAPIGALQGIAPDRVIYAGTASKTLAPGLRLGWLVPPPRLVGAIAEAKTLADRGSPVLDQLAFADFLAHGEFERHLRRMRPVYRRRRDALLAALRAELPDFEPGGIAAGLHLVAYLPPGLEEATIIAGAARRGVALYGLAPYRLSSGGRPGLTFGYATLDEATLWRGVRVVAEVVYGSPHARSPGGHVVRGTRR
jgi:GntR family transcriptional regulator/MocR family aminotransferase